MTKLITKHTPPGDVLRVRAIGPTGLRGPAAIKRFRVIHPPTIAHFRSASS
jgi:hypothetical protein